MTENKKRLFSGPPDMKSLGRIINILIKAATGSSCLRPNIVIILLKSAAASARGRRALGRTGLTEPMPFF
jgi:hypothetical protein